MWASPKRDPLADLSTPKDQKPVVTKAWNDLKPPKTIYNHLKPPTTTSKNSTTAYNHLQPPQKYLQPLANNLKPSKTRYKCLK